MLASRSAAGVCLCPESLGVIAALEPAGIAFLEVTVELEKVSCREVLRRDIVEQPLPGTIDVNEEPIRRRRVRHGDALPTVDEARNDAARPWKVGLTRTPVRRAVVRRLGIDALERDADRVGRERPGMTVVVVE